SFHRGSMPLALVIAPTRELALQVKRELEWLYAQAGVKIASCVGGMDMRTERKALSRGAHIVVGTPGRLLDHIKRKSLMLHELRALVLDEADEMLDMGFREELEGILEGAPRDRQTLLFAATVPKSILGMAKKFQNDAVRVNTVGEHKQHVDIEYRALLVNQNDQEKAIVNVLRYYNAGTAIVFCATRAAVNRLTSRFSNRGFSVVALSGELSQNERSSALQALRDGRARVCIATDVAARGLDLPNLGLVIHGDLPKNSEGLLHRSGRTGRAGRKGVSVLIVPVKAKKKAQGLLRSAKVEAEWGNPPSASEVHARDEERLLTDKVLSETMSAEEYTLAQTLIERYGAEQMAAAFVRQYKAGFSAPEELGVVDTKMPDPAKAKRGGIQDGVWFRLSAGSNQKIEPRSLLPLLRHAGDQYKRDIGSIVVREDETYLELSFRGVDRFLEAVGADMMLDTGMQVEMLPHRPDGLVDPRKAQRDSGKYIKAEHHARKTDGPRAGRKRRAKQAAVEAKHSEQGQAVHGQEPVKKKKPHKKKLARAAARAAREQEGNGNNEASSGATLKRKKRKPQ
ncbi:MAG: DEAD/DEAH box helicase, partial [Robiginitomaculum sp.]|nr:DEAD/DEAH box helicase [Robiginitomaculum sp.]